jgi:hypothetical protein
MNILQLQERLKDLPDNALMQEMQMPTGTAPQFLVLSELKRRKRMRDEYKRQEAADMPTVAEEVVTAAGMPQEGIMGAARAMAPNTNVAQNTGMDMAAPVPATRAPQPQMMADGGILRYAPGGSVGRPVEPFPANSPNPRDRSNWMAMYKDTHNLDGSPKSLSPDVAQSEGIAALSADIEDYMAPGIRMTTQDKLSAALGDVDRRVPRSLPMISSPEDQDVVRGPEVKAAMETQNVLEEMMKANQGIARDETPTGQLNVDALGNVLGFNPEDPTVGGEALRLAEASMTDAPLDIGRSNLEALMETGTLDDTQTNRDALPEVVREDDLRFSRGTSSVGSASDLGVAGLDGTESDPMLTSMDAVLRKQRLRADPTAPSLDTDAPAGPISMPIDNKGGIYSLDEQGNVVGGNQSYGARFGFTPSIDEPIGATQEAIDSAEEAAKIREAQGITDASGSVGALLAAGDEVAAQEIIAEARKAAKKDDGVASPTIRPKLRPDDLLSPTSPRGPSGPSGLSGADLSIASMLEARKKEAEADKWMALAYAGMELMKPTATIGEGLGKAGQAGLGYLTKSKKGLRDFETDMLKLQTQMDIANIRAAASGSRSGNKLPTGSSLMTYLSGKLEDLAGQRFIAAQQKDAQALTRIDAEIDEVERQIAEVVDTGTFSSGRNNNNSNDVVRDYDVNK